MDSAAIKFKTSAADKSSDASEREKFDAKALQDALDKIFNEIEHPKYALARNPFCAAVFGAHLYACARCSGQKRE